MAAGADARARDAPGGYTPLHLAADAGQGDAAAALVALGAPLEARSAKGLTPLALATFKARPRCPGPGALDPRASLPERAGGGCRARCKRSQHDGVGEQAPTRACVVQSAAGRHVPRLPTKHAAARSPPRPSAAAAC